MCGIFFTLADNDSDASRLESFDLTLLKRRGPDAFGAARLPATPTSSLLFAASVLSLRGGIDSQQQVTAQPLVDARTGNVLLWNGELFASELVDVPPGHNDGAALLACLSEPIATQRAKLLQSGDDGDEDEHQHFENRLFRLFESIAGPYAFVFYERHSGRIYFGRDKLGRRSLLISWEPSGNASRRLILSSVGVSWTAATLSSSDNDRIVDKQEPPLEFEELSADGIYRLDLADSNDRLLLFVWQRDDNTVADEHRHVQVSTAVDQFVDAEEQEASGSAAPLRYMSRTERGRRTLHDRICSLNMDLPVEDLKKSSTTANVESDEAETLIDSFVEQLRESVRRRVSNLPNRCSACARSNQSSDDSTLSDSSSSVVVKFVNSFSSDSGNSRSSTIEQHRCSHAKLAILFSGGVDSTVLAALADQCLPPDQPIDLLNIAFEQAPRGCNSALSTPTKPNKSSKKTKKRVVDATATVNAVDQQEETDEKKEMYDPDFGVPDRLSGLRSLQELNPKRSWNFVQIDVRRDELQRERSLLIKRLLYPHRTVLDDSIGCALWFASRGQGVVYEPSGSRLLYRSGAEVLLLGMGADEQLAGYSRHRARFERGGGYAALCDELRVEMARIGARNLGRDDRVLSDHGKEARMPFLDEQLVSWLNALPVHRKCDMTLPRGRGEKLLLRRAAAERLGLAFAGALPKRAIQFGSRVAKSENAREKADHICERIALLDVKVL